MMTLIRLYAFAAALALGIGSMAVAQTAAPTPGPTPPGTGQMNNSGARLTEAQITKSLETQGFTEVGTPRLSGNTYTVRAKKDGRAVDLRVDATTGDVEVRG